MDIFTVCEQEAIQYYSQLGIDLSTKENRIALTPEKKKEIFDFLVGRFMQYQFGF